VITGWAAVEPAGLDDPSLVSWVVRLERLRAAVDAASAAAGGEFDRRGRARSTGR
jgi:hypothetical protein